MPGWIPGRGCKGTDDGNLKKGQALNQQTAIALATPRRVCKVCGLIRRRPLGALGGAVLILLTIASIFAPYIAPFDPTVGNSDLLYSPPSAAHLLGTDAFGRDMLSRLLYGGRISLTVGACASVGGVAIGALFGVTTGYLGGWVDAVIQRLMDAMLAFPMLLLALAMAAALGPSLPNVIIALAVPLVPRASRISRASVMVLKETLFVEASRAIGCSNLRIILRHLVPNITAPLLVITTGYLGLAIVQEAALDYLGAGIQEPQSSWGLMMSGAATSLALVAPWIVIFPGILICIAVLAANLLGDAIRDLLDPRLIKATR